MLNLTYILTILVLNQSLCVLINAQQDLDKKPRIWNNPTSQLPSTIYQPDISGNNKLAFVSNYPHQRAPYSSNYNNLNPKSIHIFNSHYESIVPIASQPIQSNSHLSNTHNWNDITEERSAPIKPPVELHHGYRYITPAISFSNIAHLKNVIYNELGLDQNPNSLPNSPQGFVLQQIQAEIPNKINKTEIITQQTKLMDHRNTENITILTPVKNLTFTNHYKQPNLFVHRQFPQENKETLFTYETSKYSGDNNSASDIKTSTDTQISQNLKPEEKTPATLFQSATSLNLKNFTKNDFLQNAAETTINSLNVSNVLPSQQELMLNIRPSIQVFENIQPGKAILQNSSESTLKLGDIPQTKFNNHVSEVNNNKFLQYDHFMKPSENDFLSKRQMDENPQKKINPFIPTTITFSDRKPDVQSSYNIGALIDKTGNNPIPLPEYQQHFTTSQKQYMPIQSLPHDIGVSNEQSMSPKPANEQYSLEHGLSFNVNKNNLHFQQSGNPFSQHQENKVLSSDTIFPKPVNPYTSAYKYPSDENQQYKTTESVLSSNVKNNDFNFEQFRNPFIQYQQNQVANLISNNGANLQNDIYEDKTLHSTPDSKRQNQIIFPTNFVLIGSSNLVTKIPTYANLKFQDTVSSNIQKEYSAHSHRTAEERPTQAFNNEYINPRTANYQTESSNFTQNKTRTVEFPFNTSNDYNLAQQKFQPKTPIVFPRMAKNKLRSPHLVYGSPV